MNEIGMALVWCAVQATLNLLAGAAIYLVARRFGPALGATAAATTLLMLCCVTLAAFSPWPRWWSLAASDDDAVGLAAGASGATTATAAVDGTTNAAPASPLKRPPAAALSFDDYWQIFRAELRAATARGPSADARWRWPAIAGALFVACASLAVGRFVIGLFALKRYRGRLSPIADAHLVELCQSLARQTGCRRPIELKQSSTLSTPATMGWRRPVIVLPSDCQSWTDAERRVVLSHELAHIARGDYLAWLLAQLAAALHVYHPLVHWLSGRLRLEQELAADAFAAELSGGREAYLFTLAQMALRQDDRRVAWAARPFLPSRGTLLRRIEMLSQTKRLRNVPVTRRRTVALAGVAAIVALVISGIRAPVGDSAQAHAAPPAKPAATAADPRAEGGAIDLSFVPPRSVVVMGLRPARLLDREGMEPLVKLVNEGASVESRVGLKVENIEEIAFAMTALPTPRLNARQVTLWMYRSKNPFDWKPYAKILAGEGEPVEVELAGKKYYKAAMPEYYKPVNPDEAQRFAFLLPDDRTIVMGPENLVQQVLLTGGRSRPEWANDWRQLATGEGAVMLDLNAVHQAFTALRQEAPQAADLGPLSAFAPLWEKGQRLFLTANVEEGLKIAARVDCANANDAGDVRQTAQAALTLARNMLEEFGKHAVAAPNAGAAAALPLSDLAIEVLKQSRLETKGEQVTVQSQLDLDVAETAVAALAPAVQAARQAASRARATNNIKQIMIAMHNYHDAYRHLPPPVVIGPDGKTPHSWRVEILPYIEQQALYDQYKMDEPWDSDNNKRLLARMPAVFRDPQADPAKPEASYFALVGPATALGPKDGKGTKFQEITDGTSNTICIVEAKRPVPWTKPEDIDYDPDKALPRFGGWHAGGFFAGFCDGSVRFLADTIDQQTLRAAITKSGGERVSLP